LGAHEGIAGAFAAVFAEKRQRKKSTPIIAVQNATTFFRGFTMPFLLQRGGKNVPLEVQRWQYFLLKSKIPQAGLIDAQFGAKTEEATKIFQIQHALKPTGRLDAVTLQAAEELGYAVQPDNYYDDKMDDT
jgi:peptidoglycan hydrolase-like protein with peptidoglycan-binding domain